MEQRLIEKYDSIGETEAETTAVSEYTADEVIESMKWGPLHVLLVFIFFVFQVVEAMEVMLLTMLFPAIQCEWQLDSLQSALLSVAVFTGMLCGAPLWGILSDNFGRKPVMFISTAVVAYHGFLASFSPNIYWLYFLRFIVGVGIAGGIHAGVLLIEFMAAQYRASTNIAQQAFWAIGALFEVLLAWAVIPTLGWRYLIGFSAIPVTLSLLTWLAVPESVRFLLVSGQRDEAQRTLSRVTQMNRFSLPPGKLRSAIVEARGRVTDLFRPEYRRTTLQVLYVFSTVTGTYYGTSLVATELISSNYCAAPTAPVASNASSSDCGCSPLTDNDYGNIAITACAEVLIMPITIILSDAIGRKRALSICLAVVALSYFTLLTCVGSTAGVTALLFLARGFGASASTIMFLYVPEVFPTQIRALGLSAGYFVGRVGAMLTPLISQVLLRSSVHAALLVYAILCSISCILALLFPIETKGRRME